MAASLHKQPSGWRLGILAQFGAGFALLLLCAVGLGVYALDRLADVDAASQTISGHWLQTTRALGDISYLGQRFRVIEAAVVLAPPDGKPAEEKTLRAIREEVEAAFARQSKLAQSAQESTEIAAARQRWSAYLALDDQFLALAQAPGDAAATLYRTQMRDSIHDFHDAVKAAIRGNVAGADAAATLSGREGATARRDILVGLGVAAALGLVVAQCLHRSIVRPIQALTSAMTRLAEGATNVEIAGLDRGDEIGAMARASAVFRDAAQERRTKLEREAHTERAAAAEARDSVTTERERIARAQALGMRALGAGLHALAGGDLEFRLSADFPKEFDALRADFEEARAKLATALGAVVASATTISRECGMLADGARDLSSRTEQQAASLEQSSAALQQIASTVKSASASAANATAVVSAANDEAKRGAAIVKQAIAAMDGISRSAKEIGEITGLIDEIAFQTNLLALNAGVEAARAGDAGRGFAVVATEVRALAQRSAAMAKRIADLVSHSGRQVDEGVARVGATGAALERIAAEVSRLDAIVDAIASGAAEQARGLGEISTGVREMDEFTQRNAALVGETTNATQRLAEEIGNLDDQMRQFRIGDGAGAMAHAA